MDFSAAASLFNATAEARDRFWMKRYGPSRCRASSASAALRIFVRHPKKTFATISAHSDAFATQFTSASDQIRHTFRRRSVAVECNGATPRARRGRALSRGQAAAQPSPHSVSAHSGHDRSAKNTGSIRYARFHNANNQDWSRCPACMLHRGSRINLYPVERQRLVPKSCILVAARLQDGWDSSLVRLIRPTRHPQSHIRPGIGPKAWAKLIQLIK